MRDTTTILITVGPGAYPFRVLALTAEELSAGPNSMLRAKVRDAVSCENMRAARSYANGMAHGYSLAGQRSLPILLDLILAEADADLSRFAAVNLVREA